MAFFGNVHGTEYFPCILSFNPHNKLLLLPYYTVNHTANEEQSLNSNDTDERIEMVGGCRGKSREDPLYQEVLGQSGQS